MDRFVQAKVLRLLEDLNSNLSSIQREASGKVSGHVDENTFRAQETLGRLKNIIDQQPVAGFGVTI